METRSTYIPSLSSISQFSHLKVPLLCAGGAVFLILLVAIFTKLAVSRANSGVNINVQNSNTTTNDNTVISPSAQTTTPTPPTQLPYNYPGMDIQEILKKKGHLHTREERELVREYSLRKKEMQAVQESS